MNSFKKPFGYGATLAFGFSLAVSHLAFAEPALIQTAPAVSEINGQVDYSGGKMDSYEDNNFSGSITLPVTPLFGFQGDALYSHIGDADVYGGAGHFFWRDPAIGLAGITGGYLYRSHADTFQVGAEGEYYLGRFTLGVFGGLGQINYDGSAPFIDTHPTRFIGRVSADYYPVDDLRVGVSYTTAFENSLGKAELEYQTPIRGLAFTAEAGLGDHGYDQLLLGVRYYFGSKKNLRDRQRQDDPPGMMPQILQSLGLYDAEYKQKAEAYVPPQSAPNDPNNSGTYTETGVIIIEANRNSTYPDGGGFGVQLPGAPMPLPYRPPYQPPLPR
jgi:hypothetical protein